MKVDTTLVVDGRRHSLTLDTRTSLLDAPPRAAARHLPRRRAATMAGCGA